MFIFVYATLRLNRTSLQLYIVQHTVSYTQDTTESNRVGSLTIFVNPNSPIILISLLCLAAVCAFVEHIFSQLMSGRLKSPARMTDGGVLQVR